MKNLDYLFTLPRSCQPIWKDNILLYKVYNLLSTLNPIVSIDKCSQLYFDIVNAYKYNGYIIHIGDCAESFQDVNFDIINQKSKLIYDSALLMHSISSKPVVQIGRIAGQYFKPRSRIYEIRGDIKLPAYYGDGVNDISFNKKSRTPDPLRLILAYNNAYYINHILNIINKNRYYSLQKNLISNLYISHESLILEYDAAIFSYKYNICQSAHMLWIGNRTRQLNSAHIRFASTINNIIGVKIDINITKEYIYNLLYLLNGYKNKLKIIFIVRFGVNYITYGLPRLIEFIQDLKIPIIWIIDPMHGNTMLLNNMKMRYLDDIFNEINIFKDIVKHYKNIKMTGMHLESGVGNICECLEYKYSNRENIINQSKHIKYSSLCDPRLNYEQTMRVIEQFSI